MREECAPAPCKLTFDLLTLKVVSESRVTWATSVPILVPLGLSVLELRTMYATDVRCASSLNASALWGGGIIRPIIDQRWITVTAVSYTLTRPIRDVKSDVKIRSLQCFPKLFMVVD